MYPSYADRAGALADWKAAASQADHVGAGV
jgi:hypothetical protein